MPICPRCHGRGRIVRWFNHAVTLWDDCPSCGRSGVVSAERDHAGESEAEEALADVAAGPERN